MAEVLPSLLQSWLPAPTRLGFHPGGQRCYPWGYGPQWGHCSHLTQSRIRERTGQRLGTSQVPHSPALSSSPSPSLCLPTWPAPSLSPPPRLLAPLVGSSVAWGNAAVAWVEFSLAPGGCVGARCPLHMTLLFGAGPLLGQAQLCLLNLSADGTPVWGAPCPVLTQAYPLLSMYHPDLVQPHRDFLVTSYGEAPRREDRLHIKISSQR